MEESRLSPFSTFIEVKVVLTSQGSLKKKKKQEKDVILSGGNSKTVSLPLFSLWQNFNKCRKMLFVAKRISRHL